MKPGYHTILEKRTHMGVKRESGFMLRERGSPFD